MDGQAAKSLGAATPAVAAAGGTAHHVSAHAAHHVEPPVIPTVLGTSHAPTAAGVGAVADVDAKSAEGPVLNPLNSETKAPLRYLALGDSYTIGTGATSNDHNFPSHLGRHVTKATGRRVAVTNPAVNGFTTQDLIDRELGYIARVRPQLISILIGVNDLVRGRSLDSYRRSLVQIYDTVAKLNLQHGSVVAVSIPDWADVPVAAHFGDRDEIRALTGKFNAIAHEEAIKRGFLWVDLTACSRSRPITEQGWIAADRLHPGDAQYAAWADTIWDTIRVNWTALAHAVLE